MHFIFCFPSSYCALLVTDFHIKLTTVHNHLTMCPAFGYMWPLYAHCTITVVLLSHVIVVLC